VGYKIYGSEHIEDDQFLSLIGSLGSIANGITRFFWAKSLDFSKFKYVYSILLGV